MICFGGFSRLDPRFALLAGLGLALPAVLSTGAAAQQRPAVTAKDERAAKVQALKKHDEELKATRAKQRQSADKEAALQREIERIGNDRRKLNQALIDTAAKLRGAEAQVEATQARLEPLDKDEKRLRQSLNSRRAVIGEVLAALQRIGHRPPPALLARPEDALQAVRTAMMLDAVLPEMRQQVETLVANLTELVRVRKKITAERDRLKAEIASLGDERTRMQALIADRQKQQAEREKALYVEQQHARALAEKAGNIQDLIANIEQELPALTKAEHEAAVHANVHPSLAALHDPGRMAPAVAFASLHGQIPIPVNGVKLKDYGAPDGVGGTEKGISIATRAGAVVTSPADGWVVYAGPFRSYGQLLILNAGGGYHILLAGMARISVDLGQFVLTGEPVAVMGSESQIAAILTPGSSQPVLYIEFRKGGAPVNPDPWWAAEEGEKVRG
jgi:septal ring factor EnvC (AmiA/AmiB activator)